MTDKTFTKIDLSGDGPPGVCPACAEHGVQHIPSLSVYCFCMHSRTGIVRRPGEPWTLFESSSPQAFMKLILELVLVSEIAEDIVFDDGATVH